MMESAQIIYEELKSKTDKDVLLAIRKFKREIAQLKRRLEQPEDDFTACPSPEVQIICNREYIAEAKRLLSERGVEYIPTKAEQRALDFNERLSGVTQINICRSCVFTGRTTYSVALGEDSQTLSYRYGGRVLCDESYGKNIDIDKRTFISELGKLFIGEWKSRYYCDACDGEQWEITFEYNDGTHRKFVGSNDYPYNFDKLLELCGIEDEEE